VRIENRTRYPARELRAIVHRHLSRARPRIVIVLERRDAKDARQGYFRYADRSVRIWLAPRSSEYPFSSRYEPEHADPGERGAEFPRYEVCDWREELLTTAVHEAEHIRAFDRSGSADANELAAERRALHALERHRRRPRGGLDVGSWIRAIVG
jgi:hypothetical protein